MQLLESVASQSLVNTFFGVEEISSLKNARINWIPVSIGKADNITPPEVVGIFNNSDSIHLLIPKINPKKKRKIPTGNSNEAMERSLK